MSGFLDSSVLIAALVPDEAWHTESLALLMQGGNAVHAHAMLETFATLTGGRLGVAPGWLVIAPLVRQVIRGFNFGVRITCIT